MDKWTCKCHQTPETLNSSSTLLIMSNKPLTFSSSSFQSQEDSSEAYHMESCEDDVAIHVLVQREKRHLRTVLHNGGQKFLELQDEVGHEQVDQVLDWLCDVCWESRCHPELFALASLLVNRFLTECRIKVCQLQLLAVACLVLASKIRITKHPECSIPVSVLVEYADHSITEEEVKTWEKLVLSKLKWDVNLVVPHDYLEPVYRLLLMLQQEDKKIETDHGEESSAHLHGMTPDRSCSSPPPDVKNDVVVVGNAEMAATLVYRSSQFGFRHPPRSVASASIILAIRACQSSEEGAGSTPTPLDWSRLLSPGLRQRLCLTTAEDEDELRDCCNEMEKLLWNDLPKSPSQKKDETAATSITTAKGHTPVTPPPSLSANSSPFKISSTSTPKRGSSRLPLRDGSNFPAESFRRRLHSHEGEGRLEREEELGIVNKENNDSAIGMNASYASASTPNTSPTISTSSSSSTASSPDSGASSGSPKSNQNVDVIESMMEQTSISRTSPSAACQTTTTPPTSISNSQQHYSS